MSGTNEIEVLADSQVTILSERRRHAAWGAARGTASEAGTNLYIERRSARLPLPDKITFHAHAGDGELADLDASPLPHVLRARRRRVTHVPVGVAVGSRSTRAQATGCGARRRAAGAMAARMNRQSR